MNTSTNYVEKEILMERFASMKQPKAPSSIEPRLERLNLELRSIKATEANRYQTHINQDRPGPLRFNGTFTKLQINGNDL